MYSVFCKNKGIGLAGPILTIKNHTQGVLNSLLPLHYTLQAATSAAGNLTGYSGTSSACIQAEPLLEGGGGGGGLGGAAVYVVPDPGGGEGRGGQPEYLGLRISAESLPPPPQPSATASPYSESAACI